MHCREITLVRPRDFLIWQLTRSRHSVFNYASYIPRALHAVAFVESRHGRRDERLRVREENEQNDFLWSRFRDGARQREPFSRIPAVSVNGAVACVRDRWLSSSLSLSPSLLGWRVSGRINVRLSAETLATHCNRLRKGVLDRTATPDTRVRYSRTSEWERERELPGITSIPIKTSVALC